MSENNDQQKLTMDIRIENDGKILIDFFPVEFSEFIINNIYTDYERKNVLGHLKKIFCG